MALERLSNLAGSTLNGGIDSSTTSVIVTSAASFPTSGNFRIMVDSEIMKVTSVSGSTFTVTRGIEGTTAASHANSAAVRGILTEDALQMYRRDCAEAGTHGAIAVAAFDGRLLFPSDAPYVIRDKGSSLVYHGYLQKMTPPNDADFSWVNNSSDGQVITANGHLHLTSSSNFLGGTELRIRVKSAPGSTPYKVTTYIIPQWVATESLGCGICFRESSTGKIQIFGVRNITHCQYQVINYSDASTAGSNPFNTAINLHAGMDINWIRMENDGTNLKYSVSPDGYFWQEWYTNAKTVPFTTGPDQIGFYVDTGGPSTLFRTGISVLSWLEE